MAKLSSVQRQFLAEATSRYHESLPGSLGEEHLETRGLMAPSVANRVEEFRLGFVDDPLPGHEMYRGMLAIPYLRWSPTSGWSVATIRFRCVFPDCDHENHPGEKYASVAGPTGTSRLYNTVALLRETDDIAISEGEFDAITADVCDLPTVGVPGADAWKPHFADPFLGYRTVFILADGDSAGMKFANKVAAKLPNAKITPMPRDEDVSSTVLTYGKKALYERIGR